MSYLLRTTQYFIHIDYKPKQGLFYQLYSKEGYLKSVLIHNFSTAEYAATLDASDSLHVVTKTQKDQMLHIDFTRGVPKKSILLEDPNGMYDFSHLALHTLNNYLYFFYTVSHPTGNTRSLMYQNLDDVGEVEHLIHQLPHNTVIKSLATSSGIYILYTDFKEAYSLNMIHFTPTGITTQTLYTSILPLIDFNFCMTNDVLHIVYVQDAYGKQKIFYRNTSNDSETLLSVPRQLQAPCLFTFSEHLWLTYYDQNTLFMLLSVYASSDFSEPVPCTLEGTPTPCTYHQSPEFDLNGTTLHVVLTPRLRIGVVAQLDLLGIHPDSLPSSELGLLMDGLKYSHLHTPHHHSDTLAAPPLPQSVPQFIYAPPSTASEITPPDFSIPDFYPTPNPAVASPLQQYTSSTSSASLKAAKDAFMNQVPLFDATPK